MTNYVVNTTYIQSTSNNIYTYNGVTYDFSGVGNSETRARMIRSVDEGLRVATMGGQTTGQLFNALASQSYSFQFTDNLANVPGASVGADGYFSRTSDNSGIIYIDPMRNAMPNPNNTISTPMQEVARLVLHELSHAVFPGHTIHQPETAQNPMNEAWARLMRSMAQEFQQFAPIIPDPVNGNIGVPHYGPSGWTQYFNSPKEGKHTNDAKDHFKDAEEQISPLTLDLDGDGLDLIALADSTAFFDLDNDGFVERVGWVGADDALLVRDFDANGLIETRNELFGGSPSDGFASLRLLDSNADNVINASDAAFVDLKVWRDLNGNGVSEAGELQSLTAAGIASISLASVHLTTPQTIAGNSVTDTSTFTWTAGGTGTIADVWFTVNQAFSFDARPVEIVPEALFLPTLRGYGIISSLTAQMSRDATLLDLVQDFAETPLSAITDAQIRDIMYRWAGVDGIAPNARTVYGANIDSRKIVFLEHFLDDPYTQTTYGSNASPTGVADLEAAFAAVFDAVKARLIAQAHLSEVLGIGAFDYLSDGFAAGLDMEAILDRAEAAAIAAAADGAGISGTVAWWRAAVSTLNAVAQDVGATGFEASLEAAVRASTSNVYGVYDLFDHAIVGTAGADTLVGALGNDTLSAGTGNDIYLLAQNHGHDRIIDTGGSDAVVFGAGILPASVTLERVGSALDDLRVVTGAGHDVILQGYFSRDGSGTYPARIEEIRFHDGTTWTYATVIALLTAASAGADIIVGDDVANVLSGLAGDDLLEGREGDDSLAGGTDNDQLYGGAGLDTLDGGDDLDTLDGGTGDDLLRGGAGNDSLFGGNDYWNNSGNDTLDGGLGNDTLDGSVGDDVYLFARGDGQDRIYDSGGGVDAIAFATGILTSEVTLSRAGTNLDDLVISIAGGDQITVQSYFGKDYWGNHTYRVEEIRFADGTTWDYTTILSKVMAGTSSNDMLLGDDAANIISALDGNDTIDARAGNDSLDGGNGNDRLLGNAGLDTLDGGDGHDTLDGGGENDTLSGGAGNDSLFGGYVYGQTGGNDTLNGGTGNDTLAGGAGDDIYVFALGDGQDRIIEENGTEAIVFGPGIAAADLRFSRAGGTSDDLVVSIAGTTDSITIQSYFARDQWSAWAQRWKVEEFRLADGTVLTYADALAGVLAATTGNDTIVGDDFANSLTGLTGDDYLDGRVGDDAIDAGEGNDRLFGGSGIDTLIGGGDHDTLDGGGENDTLSGGAGNDSLFGGYVYGQTGGNDTLNGGEGVDTLSGGGGADYFRFELESETGLGVLADRIVDFLQSEGDRIDLSAIDANTSVAGDQAFSFIGTGAFASGTRGQLRFENRADGNTWVQADLDGNMAADFEIVLIGSRTLTAADFVL